MSDDTQEARIAELEAEVRSLRRLVEDSQKQLTGAGVLKLIGDYTRTNGPRSFYELTRLKDPETVVNDIARRAARL